MIDETLINEDYRLPEIYKGDFKCDHFSMKTTPRKWTTNELIVLDFLMKKGLNNTVIKTCLDRSIESINSKVRRRKKLKDTYNVSHRDEKYMYNEKFINYLKPNSVLDVYAGKYSFYKDHNINTVVSNDEKLDFNTDFHMKSHKLVEKLYLRGDKYDLVDLDPFGSAYDCFEYALKMAKKGVIITLGELGHKRFKRIDFVNKKYGIDNYTDFNTNKLVECIIKYAKSFDINLSTI